jgi:hypothetical protein
MSEREAAVDPGVVEEVEQEAAGIVEVGGLLAPSRDQRGDRDRAVDGAERLA